MEVGTFPIQFILCRKLTFTLKTMKINDFGTTADHKIAKHEEKFDNL